MKGYRDSIISFRSYLTLFIAIIIATSVSTTIVYQLIKTIFDVDFGAEILLIVSRYTFFLSLTILVCFIVINAITKRFVVDKPLKKILRSTDRITAGDFSVRITDGNEEHIRTEFDLIAYRLDKMAEELGDMEVLQENFISNISHEMKTPLATLQNYATLIDSEDDEEKIREYASVISMTTRKFSTLITNILRLNKLENQTIFPEKARYNLAEQIRVALLDSEALWSRKNIEIESDLPDSLFICADEELFGIVWNNLISNAVKFTPEGGKISVWITEVDEGIKVCIKDSGIGMSREEREHIFDKFYQADRSHKAEGNGLGLALVKKIMDITGAKIDVESEKGKGSTFSVLFPLEEYY